MAVAVAAGWHGIGLIAGAGAAADSCCWLVHRHGGSSYSYRCAVGVACFRECTFHSLLRQKTDTRKIALCARGRSGLAAAVWRRTSNVPFSARGMVTSETAVVKFTNYVLWSFSATDSAVATVAGVHGDALPCQSWQACSQFESSQAQY